MSETLPTPFPLPDSTPPRTRTRGWLPCPQCAQMTAEVVPEAERSAAEHDEIPEGLASVTLAQCGECLHEFEVVTRRQILASLPTWNTAADHGTARDR